MPIQRALISVFDKTGLLEFAKRLAAQHIEIVSTGGTARLLRDAGIPVRDVSEMTGWPEMLGGRVKTLHPKVHGGILHRRGLAEDLKQVADHGIAAIDMVVVNLYPFSATARKPGVTPEELIENIDIGGPAMLRSAAKNFESVAVVTDPSDYPAVAEEIERDREFSAATRLDLARKAFARTAQYDGEITTALERLAISDSDRKTVRLIDAPLLPLRLHFPLQRRQQMRYGENPHQQAALYVFPGNPGTGLAGAKQLQGKELSYNNLVDLDAAWELVQEFHGPGIAIIKHNNPAGAAESTSLATAYKNALACDPVSAFGGVLAFNRPLDAATAEEVAKLFAECIVAPQYDAGALEKLSSKKNLRLLQIATDSPPADVVLKQISGGVLIQEADRHELNRNECKVVTEREPSEAEWRGLLFGWKVCKHVKSNAIVFTRDSQTLAVGAGQMSRVDSVKLAVMKAHSSLQGSVVASDAFFPFPDGIEEAGRAGATAIIQPGGSMRDNDAITAANQFKMSMVFTGIRHFRH